MPDHAPILDFDPARSAILNPKASQSLADQMPERAVLCFFYDVIAELVASGQLESIGAFISEMGPLPVYRMQVDGIPIAVMQAGVGAPLGAGLLEETIAAGARKLIAVGGCGVLHEETHVGHAFVIESAIRDEGTSYHYLPAEEAAMASPAAVQAIVETLEAHRVPYRRVISWTTDAIYRETSARRDLRLAQGCQIVEMEASAFFAVAAFRGVTLGQLVYGGDLVVPEGWDKRDWNDRKDDRMNLFHLALEACSRL